MGLCIRPRGIVGKQNLGMGVVGVHTGYEMYPSSSDCNIAAIPFQLQRLDGVDAFRLSIEAQTLRIGAAHHMHMTSIALSIDI